VTDLQTSDNPITGRLLIVLALLSALAPFAIDLYLPAFPAMTADLGASATQVQLTLTAVLLGIAVGQLVFGPLSDRFGRFRPLVAGAALCVVASAVAALAPSMGVLVTARFVQGLTGAAGMVIGRAIISDLASGKAAARAFSLLIVVSGVAPVMAPFVGSLLVNPVGWRGVLWTLFAVATLMFVSITLVIPESHPEEARAAAKVARQSAGPPVRALWSRVYIGNTVTFAFSFAVMMAYISASPFVYQVMIGMNEVQYGILFGVNACGLVGSSALSARLTSRYPVSSVLRAGLTLLLIATVTLLLVVVTGAPVILIPIPLFVAVASVGLVIGNATGLALSAVPAAAGLASALLGALQFALAAVISPLVSISGEDTALPLAVCMLVAAVIAFSAHLAARPNGLPIAVLVRPRQIQPRRATSQPQTGSAP
jgi:DHA1 family bicyclomycin/chloramphenicol resistance-like MFS transporter